jgi:hypothetical protein
MSEAIFTVVTMASFIGLGVACGPLPMRRFFTVIALVTLIAATALFRGERLERDRVKSSKAQSVPDATEVR